MKNRTLPLLILVLLSLFTFSNAKSQCVLPEQFTGNTGVNMTFMLLPSFVQSLPVSGANTYLVALNESGMVIGSTDVDGINQTSLTLWGDDTFTDEIDGALTGEMISYQYVDGLDLYDVTPVFQVGSSEFIVNGIAVAIGSTITLEDCDSGGETPVLGCTNTTACNYNSSATEDDSSCEYATQYYDCNSVCLVDADSDGVCDELEIPGCTDDSMFSFNSEATEDDGSCIAVISGCTEETAFNYDVTANTDDSSCIAVVSGCTEETACNYNFLANTDDDSCYHSISSFVQNYTFDHPFVSVTSDVEDVTYEWYLGSELIAGFTSDTIVPSQNGSYFVVVYDESCSDTTEFTVATVDINELVEIPMNLYPNPSDNFITIDFESNYVDVQLEVFNSFGKLVLSKTVDKVYANNSIEIAVNALPTGLYVLKATFDGRHSISPWVKK